MQRERLSAEPERPAALPLHASTVAEASLLFLVIFSPLAHGGVTPFSIAVLQGVTLLCVSWWVLAMIWQGRLRLARSPVDLPSAGLLLLACLSLLWSVYPYATWIQLTRLLAYAAVFCVAFNTLRRRRRLLRVAWGLVIFGSLFATLGILHPEGLLEQIPYYQSVAEQDLEQGLRLTFVNHSNFAGYLEMVCWLCVGLALASRGAKRVLLLGLGAYVAAAVFLSLSRGGMLGLGAGFLLLCAWLGRRADRKLLVWTAGFAVFAVWILTSLVKTELVVERLETLKEPMRAGSYRFLMWRESLDVIAAHPWLGSGFGTYVHVSPRYQSAGTSAFMIDHPHNEYLERTAELGGVGGALVFVWIAVFFVAGLRHLAGQRDRRLRGLGIGAFAACLSLLAHDVVDFQLVVPSSALLFSLCAALALLCATLRRREPSPRWLDLELSARHCKGAAAAVLLVGVGSFVLVLCPVLGNVHLHKGRKYLEEGRKHQQRSMEHPQDESRREHLRSFQEAMALERYERGAVHFDRALGLDPGNARHSVSMADLFWYRADLSILEGERRASLEQSLRFYRKAMEQCQVCPYYPNRMAQLLEKLGRVREAGEYFERAAALGPTLFYARFHLARFYLKQGNLARARGEYRAAMLLNSGYLEPILDELWDVEPGYASVAPAVPDRADLRRAFSRYLFARGEVRAGLEEELTRAGYVDGDDASAIVETPPQQR